MAQEKRYTPAELKAKPREDRKKIFKQMRDKDREKVKGIFRYYEVPGGSMSFSFRAYSEDPVERFDLNDGEIYTLPLGVAKHLNKNGWYPIHAYTQTESGAPFTMGIGKKVRRFGFQSLEFVDIDDLTQTGEPLIVAP
jgi:hypothetical protein